MGKTSAHTRNRPRPVSDSLVIDRITEGSSDSPDNRLMGAREGNVLVSDRLVEGSIGAYHWIEVDQLKVSATLTSNDLQCLSPGGTTLNLTFRCLSLR